MQHVLASPVLLFVALAVLWFGGAALMSRLAGWHVVAALYPAPQHLKGQGLRFCSATLGSSNFPLTYRRCVRIVLAEDGLALCLMFPFRFHSPAFFVPWSAVTSCTEKQSLGSSKVTLALSGVDKQLTFAGALGQFIKDRYHALAEPGAA